MHMHGGNATAGGAECNMSMLWNWQVVDSCFLSSSWHVKSSGSFAASCVGACFMAVIYECLRSWCRQYDELVVRQLSTSVGRRVPEGWSYGTLSYDRGTRRATPLQQLIRAVLHVMVVGVGYLLMLVLMAFNGYLFFSVLIGTGLGKYFCDWLVVGEKAYSGADCQRREAEKEAKLLARDCCS